MKSLAESWKEEGIQIGEARGKLEVAKNLLAQKIDINTISLVTNLSIQEIKNLYKNMHDA